MSEEINIQAMEPSDILELLVIWRMTPGMSLRKRDDSAENGFFSLFPLAFRKFP